MASNKHLDMKPSELWETQECYQDGFSLRRFTKRIDQLKESAKPFGATPGQSKKRKLMVRGNKEKSRKLMLDPYVNSKKTDREDDD